MHQEPELQQEPKSGIRFVAVLGITLAVLLVLIVLAYMYYGEVALILVLALPLAAIMVWAQVRRVKRAEEIGRSALASPEKTSRVVPGSVVPSDPSRQPRPEPQPNLQARQESAPVLLEPPADFNIDAALEPTGAPADFDLDAILASPAPQHAGHNRAAPSVQPVPVIEMPRARGITQPTLRMTRVGFRKLSTQLISQVQGVATIHIRCERCETDFSADRDLAAHHSVMCISETQEARDAAQAGGEKLLRQMALVEIPVVPCPKCGHVQERMVHEIRRNKLRTAKIKIGSFVGMGMFLVIFFSVRDRVPINLKLVALVLAMPLVGFVAWIIAELYIDRKHPLPSTGPTTPSGS